VQAAILPEDLHRCRWPATLDAFDRRPFQRAPGPLSLLGGARQKKIASEKKGGRGAGGGGGPDALLTPSQMIDATEAATAGSRAFAEQAPRRAVARASLVTSALRILVLATRATNGGGRNTSRALSRQGCRHLAAWCPPRPGSDAAGAAQPVVRAHRPIRSGTCRPRDVVIDSVFGAG